MRVVALTYVCACAWRTEVDTGYFLPLLSTLLFETGTVDGLEVHSSARLSSRKEKPGDLVSPVLG